MNETFLWVPAHSAIASNEEGNRLARLGSNSTIVEAEPTSDIRPFIVKPIHKGEVPKVQAPE